MKGYLLKEQHIRIGADTYIESFAAENNYGVMFEDDTDTGYFYAGERHSATNELRILDMLHIYDVRSIAEAEKRATLSIIWSTDWLKCALVINSYCHAVFNFSDHSGYNRNAFPPANDIWSGPERKLTDEMVTVIFS